MLWHYSFLWGRKVFQKLHPLSLCKGHEKAYMKLYDNINNNEGALWLVNSVSTICPWVCTLLMWANAMTSFRVCFVWSSKIGSTKRNSFAAVHRWYVQNKWLNHSVHYRAIAVRGWFLSTQRARVALGYRLKRTQWSNNCTCVLRWKICSCIHGLSTWDVGFRSS